MLHARFLHLSSRQSLYTLQRGLAAIADLLVKCLCLCVCLCILVTVRSLVH